MSAVGKAIGGIGKAVGGVTSSLFGGSGQTVTQNKNVPKMTKEEEELLKKLLGTAGEQVDTSAMQLDDKDKQIQDLFKTNVSNFLSRKADGSIDPNALKSATAFIDQTFTTPAEEQLKLAQSDYLAQSGAQQAALGRGVQDAAFQENLFKSLANQRAQLGSQRGQLISDQVLNQPGRDIQTGLQGLSGLGAIQQQKAFAPTFLNQLNQQAFQNRMSLLNNLSNQRLNSAGITQTTAGQGGGLMGSLGQLGGLANTLGAGSLLGGAGAAGAGAGAGAGLTGAGIVGGLGSLGGGAAAAGGVGGTASALAPLAISDETAKEDIRPSDDLIEEMLTNLSPKVFKYKDQSYMAGDVTGVMAQDLEKSELGKTLVVDTSEGKAIDLRRAVSAVLASQAFIYKKMQEQ